MVEIKEKNSRWIQYFGFILMFICAGNWGRVDWISSTSFFTGFLSGLGAFLAIWGSKIAKTNTCKNKDD